MNPDRIAAAFAARKAKGQKTLITFLTAGDPDILTTERLVHVMIAEGADVVELGIPYSDPIAEGPVIQAANERALRHRIRMADVFALAGRLRERTEVPLVLLLYVNVIVQYGPDRFFRECRESGLDGVIVPDLPYEERAEIEADAKRHAIALIRMVSPVSEERILTIADGAEGFLYCVSSLGVTGTRSGFDTDFAAFFKTINQAARIPTALGFGISNGEQVKQVRQWADGVIVGSAMVRTIAEASTPQEREQRCAAFTRELRQALDA
jgi:tryptophan synthase alpha chain